MRRVLAMVSLLFTFLFVMPSWAEDAPAAAAAVTQAAPATDAPAAAAAPAAAVAAAPAADPAAAPAPVANKGDPAWMLASTLLVLLMAAPGLGLFYGGLVRTKNMLSILMQSLGVFCLLGVLWGVYGYSLAFTEGNAFFGSLDKLFLKGVTPDSVAATFSKGVVLSELAYIPAEAADAANATAGFLFQKGALDFAGGTVVHINAAVAGLVGAFLVGKRVGFGRESFAPHSLTLTIVGASLLWVGWFGFNAGSALEANGSAALAFINTMVATAAAVLAWCVGEALMRGKASMLGAASGAVAGLVAITPACGSVGAMGAIVMGLIAGFICLWGVSGLKKMLGADDALDVFGIHGVGGIAGALLTGVFAAPGLGGTGAADFSIAHQLLVQAEGVVITIVWSGVVAAICYKIVDLVIGLRVPEEEEREGLDITSHGETAYHK